MNNRELLQQALDALKHIREAYDDLRESTGLVPNSILKVDEAINALEAAIAQLEQNNLTAGLAILVARLSRSVSRYDRVLADKATDYLVRHDLLAAMRDDNRDPLKPYRKPIGYATINESGDYSMLFFDEIEARNHCNLDEEPTALYTSPPIVSLSYEEIIDIAQRFGEHPDEVVNLWSFRGLDMISFIRAIEAALLKKTGQA